MYFFNDNNEKNTLHSDGFNINGLAHSLSDLNFLKKTYSPDPIKVPTEMNSF